jgi:hypothetical protein
LIEKVNISSALFEYNGLFTGCPALTRAIEVEILPE